MARRWRPPEDAELARLYAAGIRLDVIADRLGRSADALTARSRHLGLEARRGAVLWSAGHDALLEAATGSGIPATSVARQLGKSVDQVRRRRGQLLGVRRPARPYLSWEDEAILAAWARRQDVGELARRLGRSPDAVRLRARVLGVHRPRTRARWTQLEDQTLRTAYSAGLSCSEISDSRLPTRSIGALTARARKLGLANYARRWTDIEDRKLELLIGADLPLDQIAINLTRTPEAIRQRLRKLGRRPPDARPHRRSRERWTSAEDDLLRQNRGAHPSLLSSALGRSDLAVRRRQAALGLRSNRRSPHHGPVPTRSFAPAQDRLLERELELSSGGQGKRLLALSARLGYRPGELRRRLSELRAPAAVAGTPGEACRP